MLLIFLLPLAWAQDSENSCLSSECEALSKRYRSHMKVDVDPCEDFYEYACGNYPTQHALPEHAERLTVREEMQAILDKQLIELLESTSYNNISRHLWSAKVFYDSCKQKSRELFGKDPIRHLVTKMGGWDLLDGSEFNEATFQWEELLGNILHHGVYYVFKPYVSPIPQNTSKHILMLSNLETFLKNEEYAKDYENSTQLQLHRQYYLTMFKKIGIEMGAETEKRMDGLIAFEKKLATIPNNWKFSLITYGEIKKRFNNIKWDSIFNQKIKAELGGVYDSTVMHIADPKYFDKLNKIMISTPKQQIYDYLFWRMVTDYIPHLSENYQEPLKEFNRKVFGASKIAPLREQCAIETRVRFQLPLAAHFIHTYFKSGDKYKVKEMVHNIKNAMKSSIENAEWLDETTRARALDKLKLMKRKLVYPEHIFDEHRIERRYGDLGLSEHHYFENVIKLRKAAQSYSFNMLKHEVGYDWELSFLEMEPGYKPLYNEFELPAGLLHYPLFNANVPRFINYGAIGAMIAHEITHGFDSRGSNFDERGNYRSWWEGETGKKFQNRSQCLAEQYSKEVEPLTGLKLNGENTRSENDADNGGVRIAYHAYKKELEEKKNIKGLPDFQDFTSDKMFFLAYANNFCIASNKESISHYIKTDPHTFEPYRVNIPLRNFPEFSKAYNCQRGKMMYKPENACRVW